MHSDLHQKGRLILFTGFYNEIYRRGRDLYLYEDEYDTRRSRRWSRGVSVAANTISIIESIFFFFFIIPLPSLYVCTFIRRDLCSYYKRKIKTGRTGGKRPRTTDLCRPRSRGGFDRKKKNNNNNKYATIRSEKKKISEIST